MAFLKAGVFVSCSIYSHKHKTRSTCSNAGRTHEKALNQDANINSQKMRFPFPIDKITDCTASE
jgi:hypothetical protein